MRLSSPPTVGLLSCPDPYDLRPQAASYEAANPVIKFKKLKMNVPLSMRRSTENFERQEFI